MGIRGHWARLCSLVFCHYVPEAVTTPIVMSLAIKFMPFTKLKTTYKMSETVLLCLQTYFVLWIFRSITNNSLAGQAHIFRFFQCQFWKKSRDLKKLALIGKNAKKNLMISINIRAWIAGGLWRHEFAIYGYKNGNPFPYMVILWRDWPSTFRVRLLNRKRHSALHKVNM